MKIFNYIIHPPEGRERASSSSTARQWLVRGIWIYFLLLIFEGALRKWVLPGLAGPLLIVRDPVAIALILYAWHKNLFPSVSYVNWMIVIGVVAGFTALFLGHGNLAVTIYGARILLIHFPFIFLIGAVFDSDDVEDMGRAVVWLTIPMAFLIALQFGSPQSAWVNRGIGGEGGAGFSGAMGYFRPPGTFSFTNGTTLFFSLAAAYIFYFWLVPNRINKIILLAATVGLLTTIPFSISRALAFSVVVIAFFAVMVVSRNPKYLGQIIAASVGFVVLLLILGNLDFFQTSTEVFLSRFDRAQESEGGFEGVIVDRYLGGMIGALAEAPERPFFGEGLGMGTNAGSALLGQRGVFLISEGEWGRLVGEMGALLGIAVIFIRLSMSFRLALASYKKLKLGNLMPWMLLSFALLVFPQGQWAQPTTLGFSTLIMGLLIASFNKPENADQQYSTLISNNKNG